MTDTQSLPLRVCFQYEDSEGAFQPARDKAQAAMKQINEAGAIHSGGYLNDLRFSIAVINQDFIGDEAQVEKTLRNIFSDPSKGSVSRLVSPVHSSFGEGACFVVRL